MSNFSTYFIDITKWSINIITLAALGKFLLAFIQIKEKTAGFTMICILNLFCFIFPISDMLKLFINQSDRCSINSGSYQGTTNIIASLEMTNDQFSLFWTGSLAVFTHWSLQCKIRSANKFIVYSLLICALINSLLPIA